MKLWSSTGIYRGVGSRGVLEKIPCCRGGTVYEFVSGTWPQTVFKFRQVSMYVLKATCDCRNLEYNLYVKHYFSILLLTVLNNPLLVLVVLQACRKLLQGIHQPVIFLLVHYLVLSCTNKTSVQWKKIHITTCKMQCSYYCRLEIESNRRKNILNLMCYLQTYHLTINSIHWRVSILN